MNNEPDIHTFRTDRQGIRKALGDLEAEIMELVWERPEGQGIVVREIFEVLYERRKIAYTTVMSTMTRLAKKKLLRVEKKDQAYQYYPNVTQQQFVSGLVGRILSDLLVSFSGETLEHIALLQNTDVKQSPRLLLQQIEQKRRDQEQE